MFNHSQFRMAVFAVSLIAPSTAFAVDDNAAYLFNVPAMTVDDAINIVAQQTNTPAIFPFDQVRSLKAGPLKGHFTLENALSQILSGTGFKAYITESGVITVAAIPNISGEIPPKSPDQLKSISKDEEMNFQGTKNNLLAGASVLLLTTAATQAQAQTAPDNDFIDEIIVTSSIGSRGKARTATESPVAIDAVSIADILGTGATETGRILQELVPSFNFSSSTISDGTDSLRPATLRGLGPDQTLVLINGKRRHKAALINVNTSVGRGSAGTDINAIPPSAIKGIEVLRDGASALYGSDAIAGVINFQLKDSAEDGQIVAYAGQTYDSDGLTFTGSINKGFELGEDGFVNFAYEYRNRENTNRAGLFGDCLFLCTPFSEAVLTNPALAGIDVSSLPGGAGQTVVADPLTAALEASAERQNFRIGDSDSEQHVLFVNAGLELNEFADAYAFASWGARQNESAGFFRNPNNPNTIQTFFPNGFLPLIEPTVRDISGTGGIDWELSDRLTLDTSVGFGRNSFQFQISNSNNASLGTSSPTTVDAGTLVLAEWNANVDAVYDLDRYVIALGGGFRSENYQIQGGEPASFANGGFLNNDILFGGSLFGPDATTAAGIQVFPGFSPSNEVDANRDSFAGYVEVSADITDRINAQVAGRYEDYEGFGGTFTWKLAGLAEVTDWLNVRGSVSTGFRAPSVQQLFFNSTSTQFQPDPITGEVVAVETGTFTNDSALAQGLGVPALEEETSFSFGGGIVLQPFEGASLTVDYYSIDIDDRIVISGSVSAGAAGLSQELVDAFAAANATSGQFFLNGVDTETRGVDIVGSYRLPFDVLGGNLRLTAAANITDTDVVEELPAPGLLEGLDLVTPQDVAILETFQPQSRFNAGVNWSIGDFTFDVLGQRFGEYTVCENPCDGPDNTQTFGSEWLFDAQVDYGFDNGVTVSVGANNIFDNVPDTNLVGQTRTGTVLDPQGNTIVSSPGVFEFNRRSAPFGFNGGTYYARVTYDF